jgi:hypothetical protein
MQTIDIIVADFAWLAGLMVFLVTVGIGYYLLNRPRQPVRVPAASSRFVQLPPPVADPFLSGGFGEKRGSLRRQGAVVRVDVADADLNELEHGWVVDRSLGGLGLSLSKPLVPGTTLRVRPQTAEDVAGWVEVTVRNCFPQNERWKVGCQFERTPPWNILLLFG